MTDQKPKEVRLTDADVNRLGEAVTRVQWFAAGASLSNEEWGKRVLAALRDGDRQGADLVALFDDEKERLDNLFRAGNHFRWNAVEQIIEDRVARAARQRTGDAVNRGERDA